MGATRAGWGRSWHALTFAVAAGAVVLQFALILRGQQHLGDTTSGLEVAGRPDLGTRVVRFFSYLTIWGNLIGAIAAGWLVLRLRPDGRLWRALRLDAVVLLVVIGIVHFFFLRPLLHLHGADLVADRLLHIVVPLLVLIGWLAFGPRNQIDRTDLLGFLVVPVAWLVYTLVRGAIVDWYPYPFIDVTAHGYAYVAGACVGVTVLLLVVAALARYLDPRLAPSVAPVRSEPA